MKDSHYIGPQFTEEELSQKDSPLNRLADAAYSNGYADAVLNILDLIPDEYSYRELRIKILKMASKKNA